jgi:hypothetical protein
MSEEDSVHFNFGITLYNPGFIIERKTFKTSNTTSFMTTQKWYQLSWSSLI